MSSYYYALIPIGALTTLYVIRLIRECQWGWIRNNFNLNDKIYIITGANCGLGYETTKALLARNATVIMACRNAEKANKAIAEIRREITTGILVFMALDLASFESIKKFSRDIQQDYPKFTCLICNAGLAETRKLFTKENYEIHFGTNYLGHFLLIQLLTENIRKNNSRIVIVSSMMHHNGKISFESLGKYTDDIPNNRMNPYYNNSKLANSYHARALYKHGFNVHVVCPGLCHTDFFRNYNPKWYHYILFSPIVLLMLRSAKQGAQNIILCATEYVNTEKENPQTGYIVRNMKQVKSKFEFNDTISEKLWQESIKMCSPTQN